MTNQERIHNLYVVMTDCLHRAISHVMSGPEDDCNYEYVFRQLNLAAYRAREAMVLKGAIGQIPGECLFYE